MNPTLAAAIIRFVIANEMKASLKAQGHGTLWRKVHGLTRKKINRKKLVLSNDNTGIAPAEGNNPKAFVCFWVLLNKPATSKDIFLEQAGNVVLAHFQGALGGLAGGGHFGSVIQQINEVYSNADTIKGGAEKLSSGINSSSTSSGIYSGLNRAWRAGMWDSVIGTRSEFAFAVDEGLTFGAAAISGPSSNLTIDMRYWPEKKDLMVFMAEAERKGLGTNAARQYIRGLCSQVRWSYSSETQNIIKVE